MLTHDSDSSASETALRRGVAAARAGLRSVAAAQFERAAENLPDDLNVWLWLAWVANSPDNTARCLERVLELSPGHAAATAGLTWARGLSQDMPPEPVEIPSSVTVAESFSTIVPVAESASASQESFATNVEVESDIANEFHCEPALDAVSDPQLNSSNETGASTESLEPPEELAPEVIAQQCEDPPLTDAPRRRWGDLIQRGSESPSDATAWPSLIPPPLPPNLVPPPLPTVAVNAPVEREPFAPSRFSGMFAANPVPPAAEPTTDSGLAPEANTDVEALAKSFNPPTADRSADGRPLVMVVDDSPTVRKLVSLTLERRGYRVISAFDGVAAIKELGTCRPDLILLDINMPRLDGYRLCKLIKKHEATQSIPVVMLSGKDGMFDKLRGRLVGCSDYITKPFEADALTHKVAKYLTTTSSSL